MAEKVIEVRVDSEGEVVVEAHGFKGIGCKTDTEFLIEALGSAKDTKEKAEWYVNNSSSTRRLRRIGVDGSKLCG